jgi:uroporphyrinogen-III decarboxylase
VLKLALEVKDNCLCLLYTYVGVAIGLHHEHTNIIEYQGTQMQREYYLELAKSGLHFPIGADLVLKEHSDHKAIHIDGKRLGKVIAQAAKRFKTPLAMPVMNLMLEKALMLRSMGGVAEADIPTWHFSSCPTEQQIADIRGALTSPLDPQLQANVDAVKYIAEHTNLLPVGMSIGPFSLMTKLIGDPIVPVYLAGKGFTAQNDPEVKKIETLLELSVEVILRSFRAQAQAGAKAFFIAEPAANSVYISPLQMMQGSDIFERVAIKYLRRIKDEMDKAGIDLIFHCCGELTNDMIKAFTSLRPAILSLGCSRKLWEDADIVPKDIVLYGNLPSKRFFSDDSITVADVRRMALEYIAMMKVAGHPYILGTECDVLSVPGCEKILMEKAMAIVHCLKNGERQSPNIHIPAEQDDAKASA